MSARRFVVSLGLVALVAACDRDVGGDPPDTTQSDDPLRAVAEAPEGSLDALYENVLAHSCAGQAGLCHNGQFEPNLSTPALAFASLVDAPSLERPFAARVVPGDVAGSLLVDKLRNRDVISQMPLGAHPLDEADIQAIEDWIARGAPRSEATPNGARPNRAPDEPRVVMFDPAGNRLKERTMVAPGDVIVFRMSTRDFETPDAAVPFAGFLINSAKGIALLAPDAPEGLRYYATPRFDDAGAPEEAGERLNRVWTFTVPATLDLIDYENEIVHDVPMAGEVFSVQAHYYDAASAGGYGYFTYGAIANAFQVVGEPAP